MTIVTPTLPATPTVPPPAPATTERIASFAFAVTEMSSRALTFAELSMNASVLMLMTRTPTGTAMPADAADRERAGDAELVELVRGGDAHRLLRVRAGDVVGAGEAAVDLARSSPMYALVLMVETSIAPATFTAAVPGDAGADADHRELVAVRRGDARRRGSRRRRRR